MSKEIIPAEQIALRIRHFRGEKVLLDFDLAALYDVETRIPNQAVRRSTDRFPADFMFQLSSQEAEKLSQVVTPSVAGHNVSNSSQLVMSSGKHRGKRYRPYAFTEQGVAMLSSVLNSESAVKMNIAIMRAFVQLRRALQANRELARKFSELEQRIDKHDSEIAAILEAIRQLMAPPAKPRREIGFHVREEAARYRTHKRA